jgi:hypothetical protein
MISRRLAVVCVLLSAACGGNTSLMHVMNGGVPVPVGSCTDVTLVGDLEVVLANAPDCQTKQGFVVPPHGAAALWRTSSSGEWAGPIVAPIAQVDIDAPLQAGASDKGLTTGSSDKGLTTGSSDKAGTQDQLAAGSRDKGLDTGSRDKGLDTGTRDKGLDTGTRDKGLDTGTRDKGLDTGTRDKGLDTGMRDKGLDTGARDRGPVDKPVAGAPVSLTKDGGGHATAEDPATFSLTVTNVSDSVVNEIAVVDRVDRLLRLARSYGDSTGEGRTRELADGTTLIVFRLKGLGPHESHAFRFNVYSR